jgi:hypothetical protein
MVPLLCNSVEVTVVTNTSVSGNVVTKRGYAGPKKSGRGAPPEETKPRPGREVSREGAGTGPEEKWVPEEFGRSPQRDDLSCSYGTAKNFAHEDDPE